MIFLFCKEMIGGSLKIYWSYSWFCIRFHFFIQASFIVDTEGWYCVTNGNISFSPLLFCFRSFDSLWWILFLIVGFLSKFVGIASVHQAFFLKFELFSSKVVSEEFFRRILKASPLTNPFLTLGGWHEVKCVCKKVSICLKCVFASRIDFSLNLVPLYTAVSKNAVSVSNVSAVNLIVGWCTVCLFNEGFDVWFTHVP